MTCIQNRIFYLPIVFFVFTVLKSHAQELELSFNDSYRSFSIKNTKFSLNSNWTPPFVRIKYSQQEWASVSHRSEDLKLADMFGTSIIDLFHNQALQLERQIWLSKDKKVIAIRQKIINKSQQPVYLDSLNILNCLTGQGLRLKENPLASSWNILVEKRFKNDVPECLIPKDDLSVKVDPFLILPVTINKNGESLLLGFLNQTEHLAHFDLSFKNKDGKAQLNHLFAIAEFNGIVIPPGSEKATQWIYITVGETFQNTIKDYTERVAQYENIAPPAKNAPTVFCSWYYHADSYNEKLLKGDLAAFAKNRVPFDVFLIDESWDVNNWGDMMPNGQFPSGMKNAADRIKGLGYIPGIWTCPFLVDTSSMLAKIHPEWTLKTSAGSPYLFRMNRIDHWVLDLTYPGVLQYLQNVFKRMSGDWGYKYFKIDFTRAVLLDGDYKLFNPSINRLEAYRMGLHAIRAGIGEESYLSVCGGHFGGALGIANSQRSGSDVVSSWDPLEIPKYRQNILRTWMSRLWHVDPDAMMVRRSKNKLHPGANEKLSLGTFTDKEAQVNALNQYIGGGLVSFTEDFSILDEDRRELYKHVLPSLNSSSFPVDWYNTTIPSYMVTSVDPVSKHLDRWNTLAIVNWTDTQQKIFFHLDSELLNGLPGDKFLLFEFFSQRVIGICKRQQLVNIGDLDAHSPILIKIVPWDGHKTILAGTDLHFSMGGVEIRDWNADDFSIYGTLETNWLVPVKVTAVFPISSDKYQTKTITLQPGQKRFWIDRF
jgi:alpha-galactosidase